ncbi:MAG: aminotransferase class IV, partial [Paracoccaceae bacterium]
MESAFRDPELRLIETFAWTGGGFPRLQLHLSRMKKSAEQLGFPFDISAFSSYIPSDPGPNPRRMRLTLDRRGWFDLTIAPLAENPQEWRVALSRQRLKSADPRLLHKTSDRALYDKERATLG